MDDEIIYEIYEDEGSWYQNIPPGYWFVVLFLNLGFFFFVRVEKMHPSYYAVQFIVSLVILYAIGSGKKNENQTKLRIEEALAILYRTLSNKEFVEKKYHIVLPDGKKEMVAFDPILNPSDNKLIYYRIGFNIRNIKGIRKYFLAQISADRADRGYGIGVIGLKLLASEYKGEFIVFKEVPIRSLQDWKDYKKLKRVE